MYNETAPHDIVEWHSKMIRDSHDIIGMQKQWQPSTLEEVGRVSDPQLLADEAQHGRGRLPPGSDLMNAVHCRAKKAQWGQGNAAKQRQ